MKIATLSFESFGGDVIERTATVMARKNQKTAIQEVAVPSVSDEQIEEIRKESYQKGFEQGLLEERRKIEREQQALEEAKMLVLQSVASGLMNMTMQYAENLQNVSTIVPELVMGIARKVVAQELQHSPLPSIKQTVQQALARLMNQPHIMVYVHPELVESIEMEVKNLTAQENFTGKMEVAADENLVLEDCKIEWKNGLTQRSVSDMLAQIEGLLKQKRSILRSNFAIKTYDELKETIE